MHRSRTITALAALACLALIVPPASALKVATWNTIDYPTTNQAGRQPYLRTVMAALDPDVIMLQELKTQAGRDSFLTNVLNVVEPGQWSASSFFSTCESAVFYKPAKVTLTFGGGAIPTFGPRDVLAVRMRLAGYASKEAEFRLYSVHFKAGTADPGTTDSTTRRQECADLRNNLNSASSAVTGNFLVGGDTNFYGDWEGGYARLTESQADNDGRGKDPLSLPGTWNDFGYRAYHTQSTCSSSCPVAWSIGGLDDRFDLFLTSYNLQDGEGLDLVPGAYVPFGNDGNHFNQSVNGSGFNSAVGLTVATALLNSSDHLPVMITLQAPAKVAAASSLDFGRAIVGGAPSLTLTVADPAGAPADELSYSLTAPPGFSAPAGAFAALPGDPGNDHSISMNTSAPGVKSGALTIASDDPDSLAKPVQLSGTVLDHAVASLDSLAIATSVTLDFGTHAFGGFSDRPVCVYNFGWDALQSKLDLASGVITGGGGRFVLSGGFQAAQVAAGGRCYAVYFGDAGATPDSTYQATLTFSGADEALPGGAKASDLIVLLEARPTGVPLAVRETLPRHVTFETPRPNPFRADVGLAFELPRDAMVSLAALDLSGRRVGSLLQGLYSSGRHELRWRPRDAAGGRLKPGLYFLEFRADGFADVRRIVLLP